MAHELLEEGPGSSSEEECSDVERKDGSDAETLLGDDASDMEEETPPTSAGSSQPRPLPLAGGVHASQSSYLRSPSSQLLVGSQES